MPDAYLTDAEVEAECARRPYYASRAGYIKIALAFARAFAPDPLPGRVLEIGAGDFLLSRRSVPMDVSPRSYAQDGKAVHGVAWDATDTPWPFHGGSFDVAIALQVWEHLSPKQSLAFTELCRVASFAVLSFPLEWHCPHDVVHHGITRRDIDRWMMLTQPALEAVDHQWLVCAYVLDRR